MKLLKRLSKSNVRSDESHQKSHIYVAALPEEPIHSGPKLLPSLDAITSFKDAPENEKPDLFIHKLRACQNIFHWEYKYPNGYDPEEVLKEKKLEQLFELLDHINQPQKTIFNENNYHEVMAFVKANIFHRVIANPAPLPSVQVDPDEDEPLLEPSWDHLQYVLEFFLRFIVSSDVEAQKLLPHLDQTFITKFVDLFDTEDSRERDVLKTILHRIYGKFMAHRSFIRKTISTTFYIFLYNTGKHNGIGELLEILGSIVNGFAVPLKEEHKSFLRRNFLPLHKMPQIALYHSQLSYCVTQYCEKDPTLASEIILGILKYWPQTNSSKVVLFLQEVEEILELTQPAEFEEVIVPLFSQINRCILSYHFKVAERALFFWQNEILFQLISKYNNQILPIVFPGLLANTKGHWHLVVHQLSLNVVTKFSETDSQFFETVSRDYNLNIRSGNESRKKQEDKWKEIEEQAIKCCTLPDWEPPALEHPSLIEQSTTTIPNFEGIRIEQQNSNSKQTTHVPRSSLVIQKERNK